MKDKKVLTKILFFLPLVLLILYFCYKYLKQCNINILESYIHSFGKYSAVIFILVFCLRTLLFVFPYSVMIIAAGGLFGSYFGLIYSIICVFISASLAFWISRYACKNNIRKIIIKKIKHIDLMVGEHGFNIILFMRLSLVFPFDILSYAAGLSKIRYREFILATLIGILPETYSLLLLGENITKPFSLSFMLSIILIIVTMGVPFIYKQYKKKTAVER